MSGMADAIRVSTESMEFHPVIPVVRSLRTSWEGHTWVQRRSERAGERWPHQRANP